MADEAEVAAALVVGERRLLAEAEKLLPEGEKMYPDDMYTDRTMRFMAAEIIREKALYLLDKEVPYGIGVYINKFELREDKPIYDIDADVVYLMRELGYDIKDLKD